MRNTLPMTTLTLIRHGQSQWNLENRFTGWTDVPLTEQGESDAKLCGAELQKQNFVFDIAFTSRLIRANQTLDTICETMNIAPPTEYDSALNERHYGDLQGLNKAETVQKHGKEQVQLWRRSFFTRPPNGESMEDCERRTLPFFKQYILPLIAEGKNIVIVAHGNSLRPIIKYLENLTPETTASLEVGLCTPYVYTFNKDVLESNKIIHIEGIVTKGASLKETRVEKGSV